MATNAPEMAIDAAKIPIVMSRCAGVALHGLFGVGIDPFAVAIVLIGLSFRYEQQLSLQLSSQSK